MGVDPRDGLNAQSLEVTLSPMNVTPAAIILIALLVLSGCASTPDQSAARMAIGRALEDWNTGWRVKDAQLATASYSNDADFTNAFGFHRVGRRAIESYIAEVFTFDFVMAGESVDDAVDIRFVGDDVALVRTRRTRTGQRTADGRALPSRDITHLRVFKRVDAGWHIVSHIISDARDTESPDH